MKAKTVLEVIQLSKTEFDITCAKNGYDAHLRFEKGGWKLDLFHGTDHVGTSSHEGVKDNPPLEDAVVEILGYK